MEGEGAWCSTLKPDVCEFIDGDLERVPDVKLSTLKPDVYKFIDGEGAWTDVRTELGSDEATEGDWERDKGSTVSSISPPLHSCYILLYLLHLSTLLSSYMLLYLLQLHPLSGLCTRVQLFHCMCISLCVILDSTDLVQQCLPPYRPCLRDKGFTVPLPLALRWCTDSTEHKYKYKYTCTDTEVHT